MSLFRRAGMDSISPKNRLPDPKDEIICVRCGTTTNRGIGEIQGWRQETGRMYFCAKCIAEMIRNIGE